jgi:hypothetical protein
MKCSRESLLVLALLASVGLVGCDSQKSVGDKLQDIQIKVKVDAVQAAAERKAEMEAQLGPGSPVIISQDVDERPVADDGAANQRPVQAAQPGQVIALGQTGQLPSSPAPFGQPGGTVTGQSAAASQPPSGYTPPVYQSPQMAGAAAPPGPSQDGR